MLKNFILSKNFLFIFVLLIGGIMFFNKLSYSPLGSDSIGYAQIAKEMSQKHDYLTPYHDGKPSFHTSKPPMLYWITALSGNIFGFNNFSARFGVATLALISVFILFLFVSRYYDFKRAFFASFILIFTQQYLYHARSCVTESPFSTFFMLSLVCFWIATNDNKNIHYYLMQIFIGCAIMSKQASGLFIYFVIFSYIILARDFKILKNLHFYLSFIIVPIIVLPWHIAMYKKFQMDFIHQYFTSTLANINGSWEQQTSYLEGWYKYLQILINNYWPWLPFLLYGIYKKFSNIKQIFFLPNKKEIFILCWFFVPFIIFHVAATRNPSYLNPLYPACAIICADVFCNFSLKNIQKSILILVCIGSLISVLVLLTPIIPNTLDSKRFKDAYSLISDVKTVPTQKINILKEDYYFFSSFLLFYADKGNNPLDRMDFEYTIENSKDAYFVLYKDSYGTELLEKYKDKIKLIKETKKTVFFKNYK